YYDTLLSIYGCDSIVELKLTVVPVFAVAVSVKDVEYLCIGDTLSLFAEGAAMYTWHVGRERLRNNGAFARITLPELQNQIVVLGISGGICWDTAMVMIKTEPCCLLYLP